VELARHQDLEQDPAVWRILAETEVRREHAQLDEFSDESPPALKELKRKIDTIEPALKYLRDNRLIIFAVVGPPGFVGRGRRMPHSIR